MLIKEIIVKNRIRKHLGDLTILKQSLEKHGLIYPIIIDTKKHLIAGERRLRAAQQLGWTDIDVTIKDITKIDAIDIELEENISRKDFEILEIKEGMKKKTELENSNIFHQVIYFFQHLIQKIFPHN